MMRPTKSSYRVVSWRMRRVNLPSSSSAMTRRSSFTSSSGTAKPSGVDSRISIKRLQEPHLIVFDQRGNRAGIDYPNADFRDHVSRRVNASTPPLGIFLGRIIHSDWLLAMPVNAVRHRHIKADHDDFRCLELHSQIKAVEARIAAPADRAQLHQFKPVATPLQPNKAKARIALGRCLIHRQLDILACPVMVSLPPSQVAGIADIRPRKAEHGVVDCDYSAASFDLVDGLIFDARASGDDDDCFALPVWPPRRGVFEGWSDADLAASLPLTGTARPRFTISFTYPSGASNSCPRLKRPYWPEKGFSALAFIGIAPR